MGKELDEAVQFCRGRGIDFYAVNKNYPEEVYDETISRKIQADIYIDDRNIGGFPGWSAIWQMLNPQEVSQEAELKNLPKRKRSFFGLFGKKK